MASRRGLNRPTVSFAMPTRDDLEVMVIAEQSEQKRKILTILAAGEKQMEGKIILKDYDSKVNTLRESMEDPVQEYVKNFSEKHHMMKKTGVHKNEAANAFASML